MSEYAPDKYVLVEITSEESGTYYKVFGTWVGGYLYGDYWRMNSGVVSVNEYPDGTLEFVGGSGSIYRVNKDMTGTTGYTTGVLGSIIKTANDAEGLSAKIVEYDDVKDKLEVKYVSD